MTIVLTSPWTQLGRALALAVSLFALTACVAPQASPSPASGPAYEIVAQAVAHSGGSDSPILLALPGASVATASLEGLPPEVAVALQTAAAADPAALYVVVYAGKQPSGGYSVAIDSIAAGLAGDDSLVVAYSLTSPDPSAGGTTVLTYPYVIVRISDSDVAADNVRFEGAF